jgi:hypothetical protein
MLTIVLKMAGLFALSFTVTLILLAVFEVFVYHPAPPTTPSAQEQASTPAPAEEPEVELEPDAPADSRDRVRSWNAEPPPQ